MTHPTRHGLGMLILALTIAIGASVRIRGALSAPNFVTESPVGMLRAGPALPFYPVERVADPGGAPTGWFCMYRLSCR